MARGVLSRRGFLAGTAVAAVAAGCAHRGPLPVARRGQPNIVVIFTDDQGYNDVGCYGAPLIRTPHLDRMAAEGARFTDFYSAAPVCTPSRAALLTGCYPLRCGMGEVRHVIFPRDTYGLHENEITMAEMLGEAGYATGCIGKWHLGHEPQFLPNRHGFDYYFGAPYSNDMVPFYLLRNEEVVEPEVDQRFLTRRFTEEAAGFIEQHRREPFFLYVAHSMPHIPLFVSPEFEGRSAGGIYGDVIEELDWSVGEILGAIKRHGLDRDTLVVFTSDNGPWLAKGEHGGLATPLRDGKGTTYEGGMRVPGIMRWPGHIPAGHVCTEMATTMDLFPTFAGLGGGRVPTDRVIDGKDIWPLVAGHRGAKTPHEALFYYGANHELYAVRSGDWKLHFTPDRTFDATLYNLATDPGEQKNVIMHHEDVAERLKALADAMRHDLGDKRLEMEGTGRRPLGHAAPITERSS
jgi:arylsulfatase A